VRIYVDSADRDAIAAALANGYVYGVTTNPTLLRRAGVRAAEVPILVHDILALGARELHLQVYSDDIYQIIHDAEMLADLDPKRVVVKIPATPAGYAAAGRLSSQGLRITLTAVYTVRQAVLAGSAGARYIAVYVGRMQDAGLNGIGVVAQMQRTLDAGQIPVEILAASIRDPAEIDALAAAGVATATLPPALLRQMLDSSLTAEATATFLDDARALHSEARLPE